MSNGSSDYCLSTSSVEDLWEWTERCRYINISRKVPLHLAVPLYGYAQPVIVAVTLVTNSFVVLVLSQRHLRTPTNFVLLAMAIAELSTGLFSTPWFLYYYTLGGWTRDEWRGLGSLPCRLYPFLVSQVPTVCHTATIWLTVFLAVQRYVYVCVPAKVPLFCTRGRTRLFIGGILLASALAELPMTLAKHNVSHQVSYSLNGSRYARRFCLSRDWAWMAAARRLWPAFTNLYYSSFFVFQAIFVHILPCLLMALFTAVLIRAIREADKRRRQSLFRPDQHRSRRQAQPQRAGPSRGAHRASHGAVARACTEADSTPCVRYFHSTTQMLVVLILIFLATEIPVALIFILHILIVTRQLELDYDWINSALIFRNLLILLSYPFNFAIYCGMSQQFRQTVRQLFSASTLYVSQPVPAFPHGTKRYSVVLVDIKELRKRSVRQRLGRGSRRLRQGLARGLSLGGPARQTLRAPDNSLAQTSPGLTEGEISSNALITFHSSSPDTNGFDCAGEHSPRRALGPLRALQSSPAHLSEANTRL